ncbi:hypothetical protein bas02_0056 [Veterinaerplatzvirus Jeanpiccard]|uniref:Uncharacterized protein n=1 Tax=Escherichia phage JeanPiccard TaxID=2851955 RepID=A0AAE7VU15_9CAUD|nr:hypothetical protein bas02_0056 [Escherichia phage JeanPiccard]
MQDIKTLMRRHKLSSKRDKVIIQRIIDSILAAREQSKTIKHNSKPLDIICSTPASNITYATKR